MSTAYLQRLNRLKRKAEKSGDTQEIRLRCCEIAQAHMEANSLKSALHELQEALLLNGYSLNSPNETMIPTLTIRHTHTHTHTHTL